jgi:hypothetical protein
MVGRGQLPRGETIRDHQCDLHRSPGVLQSQARRITHHGWLQLSAIVMVEARKDFTVVLV